MNPIVIINGHTIDLAVSQVIGQTKQVNDLATLDNRQTNYTNRFKGADTANNRRAFQHLGLPGNNSNAPYQKNEAYLFNQTGECFVYKGWAAVTGTADKGYDIIIYDGVIDLYKAIENKSLAELELSELDHTKNLETVLASWEPTSPYRYILADYGGKLFYDTNKINIDYIVPSVNTKWLWDKLFSFHGFTYSGSIFSTEDFINHWMTFPKGVFATIPDEVRLECSDADFPKDTFFVGGLPVSPDSKRRYMKFTSPTLSGATTIENDRHISLHETGLFRVQITGEVRFRTILGIEIPVEFNYARNCQGIPLSRNITVYETVATIGSTGSGLVPVNLNFLVNANEFDSLCFFIRAEGFNIVSAEFNTSSVIISKVVSQDISFGNALADFQQRDFLKEVLTKFGLTPFKDRYTNDIAFLTIQERLQVLDVDDWTSKFVEVEGESYTIGSYAQKNIFSFNYNDKESNYNDGEIVIDNVNLEDSKPVIKSKIYSPERETISFLGRATNTYKLWEKEITDDETVKYKSLDKRFYFLKSVNHTFATKTIGSETLATSDTITSAPVESFFRMTYNDVISDYYSPIQAILNQSVIQTIAVYLSDADVVNLDFKKLKFIEQMSSYYILNKLPNYVSGRKTKAEMIRVKLMEPIENEETPDEETPAPIGYCVHWESDNLSNIKMALDGEIDFTDQLGARTINVGISVGTVTQYVINGTTVPCSIDMTFTSKKAKFNTDSLPHVTDKVLTTITVYVEITCNDFSEITLSGTWAAAETPGVQMSAEYSNCF